MSSATKSWFDELESVLVAEAKLAGLLQHGGMIGTAREFFVSRVLRSVLPPSLHVGTGRITHSDGGLSKQIDVVLYHPNYPLMEIQPGQGLYLREGVMATIEVKSELTRERLMEALENGRSAGVGNTYVFGFTGATVATISDCVQQWRKQYTLPHLPQAIVAGSVVGMMRDEVGETQRMRFWESKHPFGALLTQLLSSLTFMQAGPLHWVRDHMPSDYYQTESAGCIEWEVLPKIAEAGG